MDILIMAGLILAGLWLADFGTASVHWFVDNYCNPRWPFIGPHYISHSHNHHLKPLALFEISFLERHGFILLVVMLTGLGLAALGWLNTVTLSALVFGGATNFIHGWSHREPDNIPLPIRALQKLGLFQSLAHHVYHHEDENGSHYALLTDHVNPVLETLRIFPTLETGLAAFGLERHWWEKRTQEA